MVRLAFFSLSIFGLMAGLYQYNVTTTIPVVFGQELSEDQINIKPIENSPKVEEMTYMRLVINGVEGEEGNSFTLIGGGLNDTGFHGPASTNFEGIGIHFAEVEGMEENNPPRAADYKQDYTRTVEGGRLEFEIWYIPTDITEWGERYEDGPDLAMTLMKKGSDERVLHASNNEFNWAIGGVDKGEAVEIELYLNHP